MSDYLPSDLLVSIFERVQIKQLGRCMVVCKTWYSIITSPDFITRNLNTAHKTQTLAENNKVVRYEVDLVHKHIFKNYYYRTCKLVGIVNGLICFSMKFIPWDPVIVLWNPSIDKVLRLPTPNVTLSSHDRQSIGFGFDDATGDFKLVRMVQFKKRNVEFTPPRIEVFKLSTGKWKTVRNVNLPYRIDWKSFNSFVNGNLHWVGYGKGKDAVIAFDLSTEEFREMILPNSLFIPGKSYHPKKVDVYKGSLILVNRNEGDYLGIWSMERYGDGTSWTRVYQRCSDYTIVGRVRSLHSGVKYKSLIINRRFYVFVDEMNEVVMVHENEGVWGLCLQTVLPRTRLELISCRSDELKLFSRNSYTVAYFESLALLDHKGAREQCGWNLVPTNVKASLFGFASYIIRCAGYAAC